MIVIMVVMIVLTLGVMTRFKKCVMMSIMMILRMVLIIMNIHDG